MKIIVIIPNKLKIYNLDPVNCLVFAKLYPMTYNRSKNTKAIKIPPYTYKLYL